MKINHYNYYNIYCALLEDLICGDDVIQFQEKNHYGSNDREVKNQIRKNKSKFGLEFKKKTRGILCCIENLKNYFKEMIHGHNNFISRVEIISHLDKLLIRQ